MLKWVTYAVFFAAIYGLIIISAAACSNIQPNVSNQASNMPVVEVQTATPEPTKAPEPTAAPELTSEPQAAQSETDASADPPRNETLYFGGRQWGEIRLWNPYSVNGNNGMALGGDASARVTMFETLYMYNLLDGSLHPLLAQGDPIWNPDHTELTIRMNPDAKWSDGTPVTADDAAYTFGAIVKHQTAMGLRYMNYIDSIEASDTFSVVIKAKLNSDGTAVNAYQLTDYICRQYVIQKVWTQKLEDRSSSDAAFVSDPGDDVVYSGPYHKYYSDDKKAVMIRDDNYWGVKLWGRLPVPKYLAHNIYGDTSSTSAAFLDGHIDIDQQFLPNVQDLVQNGGEPIYTYLAQPPYNINTTMPAAWFNMNSYGLDQTAVRKAIAIAVDYGSISGGAMAGQSQTFGQTPPSLMNPTVNEQDLFDHDAVKDLQWIGNDIDGANKLLDDAGIIDTNGDGFREYDGQTLKYNAVCPDNKADWQAAMKAVAEAGPKIGIDIETLIVPWNIYQSVVTYGSQTDYDIFAWADDGTGPLYPWSRIRERMGSEFLNQVNNRGGNWGGYKNDRADEIIKDILTETDKTNLKELYTEAVKIYLTDVPSFTLMYKPELFYTVNESVWTGFPKASDNRNIPPTDCTDGYGIAGLYYLKLAGAR